MPFSTAGHRHVWPSEPRSEGTTMYPSRPVYVCQDPDCHERRGACRTCGRLISAMHDQCISCVRMGRKP